MEKWNTLMIFRIKYKKIKLWKKFLKIFNVAEIMEIFFKNLSEITKKWEIRENFKKKFWMIKIWL